MKSFTYFYDWIFLVHILTNVTSHYKSKTKYQNYHISMYCIHLPTMVKPPYQSFELGAYPDPGNIKNNTNPKHIMIFNYHSLKTIKSYN